MMCGDIMNIWNVKSVRNILNHLIGTVSAVQMRADEKQEDYLLKSTNNQTNIKKHYYVGINHQQGQRLRSDTEASQIPKHWLLNALKHIKTATQINAGLGIGNMVTGAETTTQDILTEKQLKLSLMNLVTNALSAMAHQLKLTTLSHYQKVAQTILITYNHYANPVTLRKATDESYL